MKLKGDEKMPETDKTAKLAELQKQFDQLSQQLRLSSRVH